MTTPPVGESVGAAGIQAKLTTAFLTRQFFLLFVIATLLLLSLYFYNFYNGLQWEDFWALPHVTFKYFTLPAIIVLVYGYVYLWGVLFALVPSERSFQLFFYGIMFALFLIHYDHSILDWAVRAVFRGDLRVPNPVSLFKVALATGILSTVVYMHYNILGDDFTKRLVRRGIPTEELAHVRTNMMTVLAPILFAASVIAVAIAFVGEFSALVFQDHGLFPKIEILLLGVFGVAIGFVLRSIIRELYQGGGEEEAEESAPAEPRQGG